MWFLAGNGGNFQTPARQGRFSVLVCGADSVAGIAHARTPPPRLKSIVARKYQSDPPTWLADPFLGCQSNENLPDL